MQRRIHILGHSISDFSFIVLSFLIFSAVGLAAQTAAVGSKYFPTQPADIVRDPADIPAPVGDRPARVERVTLLAKEVIGKLDPTTDTTYRYWTFNGRVPGPMIRVLQGDTIEVTLRNDATSRMVHSVDFHAAVGPGGGAELSQVPPGQTKTFTFQATTPGLFVYHCGTPMVADHIANGMYGLILVEPPGGLSHVDREYYIMQGEIYTTAPRGKSGFQAFSEAKLMEESPQYFVFNGAVDALTKEYLLHATVGEIVRIFFGDAGPNQASSLHVVGEIFTRDYVLGSLISSPINDVQTASVPPGSGAILELKAAMPGQFTLVDHAMARRAKGLIGTLDVTGANNAQLMHAGRASETEASLALATTTEDAQAAVTTTEVNSHAAPAPLPGSDVHSMFTKDASHSMTQMDSKAPPQHGAQAVHRSTSSGSLTQLDGCLTSDGLMPKLTLFHSHKLYRLEPRAMLLTENPLTFANNINALVHVTGQWTHQADIYDADHAPVFMVITMDQLAPTCSANTSLAQLRKQMQKPRVIRAVTFTNTIRMGDMAFLPASAEVEVGQRVVWQNTSAAIHNVVDDAAKAIDKTDVQLPVAVKPFDSGDLQPGQSFVRVFNQLGVYRYVCTLHEGNGMKGVIVVRPRTYVAHDHTNAPAPAGAKEEVRR